MTNEPPRGRCWHRWVLTPVSGLPWFVRRGGPRNTANVAGLDPWVVMSPQVCLQGCTTRGPRARRLSNYMYFSCLVPTYLVLSLHVSLCRFASHALVILFCLRVACSRLLASRVRLCRSFLVRARVPRRVILLSSCDDGSVFGWFGFPVFLSFVLSVFAVCFSLFGDMAAAIVIS